MKQEKLIESLLKLSGWLSLGITMSVLGVLIYQSTAFFSAVPLWEFLTGTSWIPFAEKKAYGIWPLLSGTLLTAGIALLVAMPLGILIAIYLSEYATNSWRRIARPALDLLAAIPTVVYGFLALVFLTPLLQWVFPGIEPYNALSPGLVMAFMILPIITSISEDAMRAVPKTDKEAALALGATRWQVVRKVVVPAAFNGITAAVILAFSRALGETMIVSIAAGQQAHFTFNPVVAIQTASSYIIQMSLGDVAQSSIEYSTIFAIGLSLFLLTYALNNLSFWFRNRYRKNTTLQAA
ncbi:MAG: phosphate ABC transporter permease subunit PstC [Sphingobacteriaceae bacterium]|nr:phosphate ABC transporter permease subunit PstC [Sphingobacteriaceae bacterium]